MHVLGTTVVVQIVNLCDYVYGVPKLDLNLVYCSRYSIYIQLLYSTVVFKLIRIFTEPNVSNSVKPINQNVSLNLPVKQKQSINQGIITISDIQTVLLDLI